MLMNVTNTWRKWTWNVLRQHRTTPVRSTMNTPMMVPTFTSSCQKYTVVVGMKKHGIMMLTILRSLDGMNTAFGSKIHL